MIIFSRLVDLHQHPSTFWSITLQPLVAGQATIQKMKGDINSFHMRHKDFIHYKRLQSYEVHKPLVQFRLVYKGSWQCMITVWCDSLNYI